MTTKKELQEQLDVLSSEYEITKLQWFFVSHEQEKIALVLEDVSKQLGLNISFNRAYYHQYDTLVDILKSIGVKKLSRDCVNNLKEVEDDFLS